MKEQLVSFETAKLATEKGFDIITRYGNEASLYNKHGCHTYYMNYGVMYSGLDDSYIPAPTQSLLQKWLREKYFRETIVLPTNHNKYFFVNIYRAMNIDLNEIERAIEVVNSNLFHTIYYDSYEEALEEGLYQTLLLI